MDQEKAHRSILDRVVAQLSGRSRERQEQILLSSAVRALDSRYSLAQKMMEEPGLEEIIKQLVDRIHRAYGSFDGIKGRRILDIACGSNSSRAPSFVFISTPSGEERVPIPAKEGYTALFEPWFCRILLELGAHPVGVDIGNLEGEAFEHHSADLGQPGALNFLPDHSFDAVQDSRLFGSPEFTAQFPERKDRLRVADEIRRQERRLLKPGGIVIHSDAMDFLD